MENGKLDVDGIKIAYGLRGAGKTIVLLHGYPLDRSIWDSLAPLLEQDFQMVIPDLRGFGESEVADSGGSIDRYASDVRSVMQQLRIPTACIVGHSMGGYVALAFARSYPERTAGIGLISSQTAPDSPERKQGRYTTAKRILLEGVGPVAETMSGQLTANAEIQGALRSLISRQRPEGLAFALEAMAERPDSMDVITGSGKPTLIVHGDADALIPVDKAREIKQAMPGARYTELPGAGHMPMLENPRAVAEALRFFLTAT